MKKKDTLKRAFSLLFAAILLIASGCAASPKTPVDTADAFLTALRDGKTKKAQSLMYNPEAYSLDSNNGIELNAAAASRLSWTFGEESFDSENNYYMVDVKITMVDVAEVLGTITEKYYDQMLSDAQNGVSWQNDTLEQELLDDLSALIESQDAPMKTQEILMYLVPDDDAWLVFVQDDLINAVTGGVLELYEFYREN